MRHDSDEATGEGASGGEGAKPAASSSGSGVLVAFCAFVIWGILPVFWKALDSVDSFEVLCHRITWSFASLVPFMFLRGRLGGLLVFLRSKRNLLGLLLTGYLLAGNWYLYIWAITSNKVIEASLGYYINPLVNILFGIVIFREKASPLVWVSISIAALAVLYQVIDLGHPPYVPLGLAFSFGFYGLLRKVLMVEGLSGLFMETLVVMPLVVGYLVWQASLGNSAFFRGDPTIDLLLISAGMITTVPLLCFVYAAKRIRMTTLGILQYLTPTWVLLLGTLAYGEPFTTSRMITFGLIWTALALYTWDTTRRHQW